MIYGRLHMIRLTRLNRQEFILNSDLIETVEATPDTMITLMNGKKYIVLESAAEVVDEVVGFRWRTQHGVQIE